MPYRAIEAALMPDGSLWLSEPLQATAPQRLLLTILNEPPLIALEDMSPSAWERYTLVTASVPPPTDQQIAERAPLTPEARAIPDVHVAPDPLRSKTNPEDGEGH